MANHAAENFFSQSKLDGKNRVPLHIQIERLLQDLISHPPYSYGARLPDELTMAAQLGVSRGTVRESILELTRQGLLERRKGVGTRKVQSGLGAWTSLIGEMSGKNIDDETFVFQILERPANGQVSEALRVSDGTPFKCLREVCGRKGRPILQSNTWIHPRLGLSDDEDFRRPPYEVTKNGIGIEATHASEELFAVTAGRITARLLKVKTGTPLLLRVRISFDANNCAVDYSEMHYNTSY
jgi:GntR family transcriptional regulator